MLLKLITINKSQVESSKLAEVFQKNKFEGKYLQTLFLPSRAELYLGTDFEKDLKTADRFHMPIAFDCGAVVGNVIKLTDYTQLELTDMQGLFLLFDDARLAIVDLVLGIKQGYWQYSEFLKEAQKKLEITLNPRYEDFDSQEQDQFIDILDEAITLARTVVDTPPKELNPSSIIQVIQKELESEKIELKIRDSQDLKDEGFNSVLAVGGASIHKPTMIEATVKPSGEVKKRIVLVGKGVTYDTGGNDIKVGGNMLTMKMDMAGAGTMFGVLKALKSIDLESTEVVWLSAFVENSVSGNSYKSDDIIRSLSGLTVEVLNTDAEGRLVLSDLLAYATTLNPDLIVDAATLTGASVKAIGKYYAALMGNDKYLLNDLYHNFMACGERIQRIEMPEIYRENLKGHISDLKNMAKPMKDAGHVSAGLFLSHFVDQNNFRNPALKIQNPKHYSWAHLDIAGSAYNNKSNQLGYHGATGHGIRSLLNWIIDGDE